MSIRVTIAGLFLLFTLGCGDSESAGGGGAGSGGAPGSGGEPGAGGSSACTEITVSVLQSSELGAGDYNYEGPIASLGGPLEDRYLLELYDGLDTSTVDLATDSKNGKPSTCEACGWVFEDDDGTEAARIYYHESGTITLLPTLTDELAAQPDSGTIADITFREVTLSDPQDLYTATFVPDGACVHLVMTSF